MLDRKHWRAAAVGLAVLVCGTAAGNASRAAPPSRAADLDAAIEQYRNNPVEGPVIDAFERDFPSEWAAFKAQMVAKIESGATDDQVAAASRDAVGRMTLKHLPDVASAPTSALVDLASASRDFEAHLQRENAALCAKFAMSGISGDEQLSPKARELLAVVGAKVLDAAKAGEAKPTARPAIAADDLAAMRQALAQNGATESDVAALFSDHLEGLSTDDQCRVGVALYTSFVTLPAETGAKWLAVVMVQAKGGSSYPGKN